MFQLVRDIEVFDKISVNPSLPLFCDTETCEEEGLSSGGLYGKIRLVQIYQEEWENAILFDCFFIPLEKVLNLIKPCKLVFHNGAYDLHTINLKTKTTWLPKNVDDTLYLSRLQYFTKQKFGFYDCLEYAGLADKLIKSINKKEEQKSDWGKPLSKQQKTYAAADVIYLHLLYNKVKSKAKTTVYQLDIQNLKHAINYSRNGMPVNQKTVLEYKKKYMNRMEDLLEKLPVNPNSPKQCCEYLGTSSSNIEVLTEMMYDGNQRAKDIHDARHCSKSLTFLNTYDRPFIKGFFQPCAAISGRFSCTGGHSYSHANLQQMPEKLHGVIEAPKGKVIIYKDYSGLELRMAVAYTGEPMMGALMRSGKDMHTETAKFIFNKEEISDLERTMTKVFNFSLIYGSGIKTVQATIYKWTGKRMPFGEVKSLISKWFDMYDYFDQWHTMHKNQLNIYGYVDIETALGRHIRTYKLTDSLNFPIQGSSVEVQKTGLGLLFNRYPDVHLINTIHDSNILLANEDEAEKWGNRLSECMVEAWHYVIQDLADPEIPMPHGFDSGPVWIFH